MESTFHSALTPLEQVLVDLCRMGLAGDSGGIRLAARRLLRNPPPDASHADVLRQELGSVLANAGPSTSSLFRAASMEDLPVDGESALTLASLTTGPADEPILSEATAQAVADVVVERQRADELEAAGVAPTRTVLLTGPPGVGKTMTAHFIGAQLDLPVVTIDLATVMSSYLGRTGQNLRAALRYGREHACVTFIDEFDALAKRRDDESDIGELKRLVNVLLLELERWPTTTLLVAATNHEELLDRAIARRFDTVISMGLPGVDERRRLLAAGLDLHRGGQAGAVLELVAEITDGMSGSDLGRLVNTATRRAVLDGEPTHEVLLRQAAAHATRSRTTREQFCVLAHEQLGWSQRRIATLLGVTHPTVGSALKRGTHG